VFDDAPPSGAAIMFRVFEGLVQTVYADDSIHGSSLVDGSVGLTKLTTTAGAAKRVLSADASGVVTAVSADHTYISDFDSRVRVSRLDQMAAPTANLSVNNNKITNLSSGTASTDAATKGQLDSAISGVIASAVSAAQDAV